MPTTRDRQLPDARRDELRRLAEDGAALTLGELAVVTNFNYNAIRWQAKQPGFPRFCGKVIYEDWRDWRRRLLGLDAPPKDLLPSTRVQRRPAAFGRK